MLGNQIEEVCKKVLHGVGSAVACGVIDINKREMRHLSSSPLFQKEKKEVITERMIDFTGGEALKALLETACHQLKIQKKEEDYYKEVQIAFEHNFYFAKTIKEGRVILFLVTQDKTNIGMAWVRLRSIVPTLEFLID